jgi:hypothetical protein
MVSAASGTLIEDVSVVFVISFIASLHPLKYVSGEIRLEITKLVPQNLSAMFELRRTKLIIHSWITIHRIARAAIK